jgi:hypothetical protein
MSKVSEAVFKALKPDKLNYELWWTPKEIMFSESVKPINDILEELKSRPLEELNRLNKEALEMCRWVNAALVSWK